MRGVPACLEYQTSLFNMGVLSAMSACVLVSVKPFQRAASYASMLVLGDRSHLPIMYGMGGR